MPEQGRIRTGVKTAKAMKAIDTFRFTSPDQVAINQLAEKYGGTPKPWVDAKQKIKGQWEVITTAKEIRVVIPADSVTLGYELWEGSGRARSCDGEWAEVAGSEDPVPCLCSAAGKLRCEQKTRLKVIIPDIKFGGSWRYESKGENAFNELATMADFIEGLNLHTGGSIEATMRLEERQQPGKRYNVVTLSIDHSPDALLAGEAQYGGPRAIEAHDVPAIEPVGAPELAPSTEDASEGVVDAEIVGEEEGWASKEDIPPNTAVTYNKTTKRWMPK
jgi:hypothetical protein